MLQALEAAAITPDLILGTSIGAFNGSVVAAERGSAGSERLAELWDQIAGAELFKGGVLRSREECRHV